MTLLSDADAEKGKDGTNVLPVAVATTAVENAAAPLVRLLALDPTYRIGRLESAAQAIADLAGVDAVVLPFRGSDGPQHQGVRHFQCGGVGLGWGQFWGEWPEDGD